MFGAEIPKPTMLTYTVLAPIGGRLAGKLGSRWVLTVGLTTGALAMFGLAWA